MKKFIISVLCGLMAITGIAMAGNFAGWFHGSAARDTVLPPAGEEYRKLYERFMQQDSTIDLSGDILLYDGENRSGVKERNSFHFIKNGIASYSQLGYIQNYCNGKLLVQLDTVNKFIIVARAGDQSAAQTMSKQPSIDMLFSDTASFKISGVVSGNDHERTIRFRSDFNPEIRSYNLIYDPVTYRAKGAEIEWWKDAAGYDTTRAERVWITHISYRYNSFAGLDVGTLMGHILTIDGNQAVPAGKYKDYHLRAEL